MPSQKESAHNAVGIGQGGLGTVTLIRQPRDQHNSGCLFHLEFFPPNSLCRGAALKICSCKYRTYQIMAATLDRFVSKLFPNSGSVNGPQTKIEEEKEEG